MHTQPLPENVPDLAPQALESSALLILEWQDPDEALELIEMRYQEHRARMDLHAVFPDGGIGCL